MRSLFRFISLAAVVGLVAGSIAPVSGAGLSHRIGFGAQYDMIVGDTDDGRGGYLYYMLDLPKPVAAMVEVSYVTGEFDVKAGSGDYTTVGVAGAILAQGSEGTLVPYLGAGAGRYFNDFDNDLGNVRYEDKYGMFLFGGTRLTICTGINADISVRYRVLRPSSLWQIEPNPIDMDAWIFRIGVTFEL